MIELGANRYGKAQIRVVRVVRGPGAHRLRDLTVAIALEGDFTAAHVDGDNELVVATDTMKNTAYAFAKAHLDGSLEDVRPRPRRPLPRVRAGRPRERLDPRARLVADRHAERAGARCLRPRRQRDTRRDRGRRPRRDDDRGRRRGSRRHEDRALGVQRFPARRVHDAARHRRPDHGHEGHRDLALRLVGPCLGRAPRRGPGDAARGLRRP